jgi:transcription antitermination factor NusG
MMLRAMAWRAIYAEPRREFAALAELRRLRVGCFCPYELVTERKRWRGGWRMVSEPRPYFRGYLFADLDRMVYTDPCNGSPRHVEKLPGVLGVVGNGRGEPLEVPKRDIDLLLDVADENGMISAIDATRLSYRFRGRVGDVFEVIGCGLEGACGKIVSLDRLDSKGEVRAIVKLFGAEREIDVPYQNVSNIRAAVGGGSNRAGRCDKPVVFR